MPIPSVSPVCPVCGDSHCDVKYAAAPDYVTGDEFEVLQCRSCQVAYTHPAPASLDQYYLSQYRHYRSPILDILGLLYRTKARRWARMFPKPGRLLEIGCGPGIILRAMRELGWQSTGLERNEEAAEYGRRKYGLEIFACDIDELPEQTYDLIILFQVLEHMSNPRALLESCYRRLNPGGRIIVAVPNFGSWQARVGGTKWLHLDVPRHLFHFSPPALTHALQKAGFRDPRFEYVSFEHDPYGWLQTTLNRVIVPSNTLLRYLMGLKAQSGKVVASLGLGMFLAVPSVLASMLTWAFGQGAIVSVIASRPAAAPK